MTRAMIQASSRMNMLDHAAGRVAASWGSILAFSHGSKAVVNDADFYFLSSDDLTHEYDQDIATEIRAQFPAIMIATIGALIKNGDTPDIVLDSSHDDGWFTALAVLITQRLSVAWSKSLGVDVGNPFARRNLTRVVSGEPLYV
ncbi:hypothetical protein [Oceaniovalibus sp. ACAM 378]|uniref:hypothetical protein n=1 Tax=Oceaniovalibus sp. ACAM 378 TaxID=2599923 RepID=UPI0011D47358|nr:hypothetical protein [Oceaniovalibus sp. ACAM 378]TYB89730.1 hypothetical protein FQ320_06290 [Oceaniovalibus sp. ACAM 378]